MFDGRSELGYIHFLKNTTEKKYEILSYIANGVISRADRVIYLSLAQVS